MSSPVVQQNINLQSFNTFGIHAKSRFFSSVKSIDELQTLLQDSTWKSLPTFILGGGSNILLTQDYPGLVIKNEIMGINRIKENDDHVWLKIGAGENWHDLVMHCVAQGLGGIENLSLIPGTVGAAPIQNIGAYGVELCDVFQELEAVRIADGNTIIFKNDQCEFGYRASIFKSSHKNQFVIATVTLRLNKNPQFNTSYGAVREVLDEMKINEITLKAVSDAVIQIRRSKLPDPNIIGNAGSFFKNPIVSQEQFVQLQKSYTNMPHFSEKSSDAIKIPAGWLIEQCGWKGKRLGNVGVYDKQALVLVNYGSGTGADIQDLARQIQASVNARFGIELTPEVNII